MPSFFITFDATRDLAPFANQGVIATKSQNLRFTSGFSNNNNGNGGATNRDFRA